MSFAGDLARFQDKTGQTLEQVRRGVLLRLFSAIIKDTPVLSGRLRGNWQTSVGSPTTGVIPIRSEDAAIAEAEGALRGSTFKDDVYLRNNLPYAWRIEFEGWSKEKAPEGMMRKNVVRFRRLLQEEARKAK